MSGCATNPSSGVLVVGSSIIYGPYAKYIRITVYNDSNLPLQATSVSFLDLNTGENFNAETTSGKWYDPGETWTTTTDPIPLNQHGSAQITFCGRYTNGQAVCDTTIITL